MFVIAAATTARPAIAFGDAARQLATRPDPPPGQGSG